MRKIIRTSGAPAPIGPYNQAVMAGGALYVSGQVALDPETGKLHDGPLEEETRKAIENLSAVLQAAGLTLSDVVKCSLFVRDMGQFAKINAVYAEFFGESSPARETVEVSALPAGANFEISCIAVPPAQDEMVYSFAEDSHVDADGQEEE